MNIEPLPKKRNIYTHRKAKYKKKYVFTHNCEMNHTLVNTERHCIHYSASFISLYHICRVLQQRNNKRRQGK